MDRKTAKITQIGLGAAAEAVSKSGIASSGTANQITTALTSSRSGHIGQQLVQGATAAAPLVAAKATVVTAATTAAATAAAPILAGAAAVAAVGYGAYKLFEWMDS